MIKSLKGARMIDLDSSLLTFTILVDSLAREAVHDPIGSNHATSCIVWKGEASIPLSYLLILDFHEIMSSIPRELRLDCWG